MNQFPIIRLELDHMKQTMLHMFSEKQLDLSEEVKRAMDRVCTQENIQAHVNEAARQVVESAVKDAVRHWWLTAPEGQALIKEEINRRMKEEAELYAK